MGSLPFRRLQTPRLIKSGLKAAFGWTLTPSLSAAFFRLRDEMAGKPHDFSCKHDVYRFDAKRIGFGKCASCGEWKPTEVLLNGTIERLEKLEQKLRVILRLETI